MRSRNALIRQLMLTMSASMLLALVLSGCARFRHPDHADAAAPVILTGADPETTKFLVVAGGGAPSYNEIALEKNVLYFRRTLTALGLPETAADVFFANGNDGQATVRYLNALGFERFKPPEIGNLQGAATYANVSDWFDHTLVPTGETPACSQFFYFTGHGLYNEQNPENNALILWGEDLMDVEDFATRLDAVPSAQPLVPQRHFVTMMAQCYAGAFANLIYEGGNPEQPVALQSRCGFFATVASRPSVGCTPAVNEADYRDYSSSFFAGLSGIDRVGQPVASADYDQDGIVSYSEAHAFAKVDEETSDWPISTVEAWLQRQITQLDTDNILSAPMSQWLAVAEPQRRYVIAALADKLDYDLDDSYNAQTRPLQETEVQEAYRVRLEMELMNVGMTQKVGADGSEEQRRILKQLTDCETSSPVE